MTPPEFSLLALVSLAAIGAVWHLVNRWLTLSSTAAASAKGELAQLVERNEAAAKRNEAALVNFLEQIMQVTNFQERTRREAAGNALQGKQGWKK
jgi:uncharacterized protein (UPF0333 family)